MTERYMPAAKSVDWATPRELYDELNQEFLFDDDPCPLYGDALQDGLSREWGHRVFLNPPYGRAIVPWVKRSYEQMEQGKLAVCLLPVRSDTAWWHDYVMKATDIRFVRGRLKFGRAKNSAPFPSAIVIFDGRD